MSEPNSQECTQYCFVVMPISDSHGYESGHFGRVYEHLLKPAILEAGYIPIRADDTSKTDYIVVDIIRKIIDSSMILCDLSARNPNVMYELGICHAFNKPVVLIKDRKTEKIFDIQGLRYAEYEESLRIDSVLKDKGKIVESLIETKSAPPESINSVVQLAGIKPANVPESTSISGDTQMILNAIGSIDKRLLEVESGKKSDRSIRTYLFPDGTLCRIGGDIFDSNGNKIGELEDFDDSSIFVAKKGGGIIEYLRGQVKQKKLSAAPF